MIPFRVLMSLSGLVASRVGLHKGGGLFAAARLPSSSPPLQPPTIIVVVVVGLLMSIRPAFLSVCPARPQTHSPVYLVYQVDLI